MSTQTIKTLLNNNTKEMYRVNEQGFQQLQKSCWDNVSITGDYTSDNQFFKGTLNFSGTPFENVPWLQGLTEEASFAIKESYDCEDTFLTMELTPPSISLKPLQITVKKATLQFNRWSAANDVYMDQATVVFDVWLGEDNLSVQLQYPLFESSSTATVAAVFYEGSNHGIPLTDCVSMLPRVLGQSFDIKQYIPDELDFVNDVRLYNILIDVPAFESKETMELQKNLSMSVEIGISDDVKINLFDFLSLENIRLNFSFTFSDKSDTLILSTLRGTVNIGGEVYLLVSGGYPGFDLSASLIKNVPVNQVVNHYMHTDLPVLFQNMELESLNLRAYLKSKSFHFDSTVTNLVHFPVGSQGRFDIKEATLLFDYNAGEKSAALQTGLSLTNTSTSVEVLSLAANGTIDSTGLVFNAHVYAGDQPDISINNIYQTISGAPLPNALKDLSVTGLELGFRYGKSNDLNSLHLKTGVKKENYDLLGIHFDEISALLEIDSNYNASLAFNVTHDYFHIYAKGTYLFGKGYNIEYRTMLDMMEIILQAGKENNVPYIFGRIQPPAGKIYSLADAAGYFAKQLTPEFDLILPGMWSFLKQISLNGVEFRYYITNKKLQIMMDFSKDFGFLQISKAGLEMNSKGVYFLFAGNYLGTVYTEQSPLRVDTASLPESTGSFLDINYFALANHVKIDTKSGSTFEDKLQIIKNNLNDDTDPSTLTISNKAGFLLGSDMRIADTADVKLLYNDFDQLYGADFALNGAKAGALNGIQAQIMYKRLNENVGVFSGKIIPPQALKNINLGSFAIGIGNIAAEIKTNGDFMLDLGYPEKSNFSNSFSLRYGILTGRGGIKVSKDQLGISKAVPATTLGYFSPVLAMAVGMQLTLDKGFNVGILSAGVHLSMTGLFSGVYATFVPYNKTRLLSSNAELTPYDLILLENSTSDMAVYDTQTANSSLTSSPYFKVNALVNLTGKLTGSVNFGPIGAGVSLLVSATAKLDLETGKETDLDLYLDVKATAQVKIFFIKFNYNFSTNLHVNFKFGSVYTPPWVQLARSTFVFPQANSAQEIIHMDVVPVFTPLVSEPASPYSSDSAVALLPTVSPADFQKIVARMSSLLEANNALGDVSGLELFANTSVTSDLNGLLEFVKENFKFVLQYFDITAGQTDINKTIFMALPYELSKKVTARFTPQGSISHAIDLPNGTEATNEWIQNLDAYYENLISHVSDTVEDGENGVTSTSQYIFAQYFQTLLRAIRIEKQNSAYLGEQFNPSCLTERQLNNIAGMTQHFLLSGKQIPFASTVNDETEYTFKGIYDACNQQDAVFLTQPYPFVQQTLSAYEFDLASLNSDWIEVEADSGGTMHVSYPVETLRPHLPTKIEPDVSVYVMDADQIYQYETETPLQFNPGQKKRFTAAEQANSLDVYEVDLSTMTQEQHIAYTAEDQPAHAGLVLPVVLHYVDPAQNIYSVNRCKNISKLKHFMLDEQQYYKNAQLTVWYHNLQTDEYKKLEKDIFIVNQKESKDDPAQAVYHASLADNSYRFTELLYDSLTTQGEYLLYVQSQISGDTDELELIFLFQDIRIEDKFYQNAFNAFLFAANESEQGPLVQLQVPQELSQLDQGTVSIQVINRLKSGITDQEKAFQELYSNLLFEFTGPDVEQFSLPVMPRERDESTNTLYYDTSVPFYKLINSDNIYAGIQEQTRYSMQLYMVDVLGNRFPTNTTKEFTMKYSDKLLALSEYQGFRISYYFEKAVSETETYMVLKYEFVNFDDVQAKQRLLYAREQFMQDDITLWLKTDFIDEEVQVDDSNLRQIIRLIAYLSGGSGVMSATQQLTLPMPEGMDTSLLQQSNVELILKRKQSLCYPGVPEFVYRSVTRLNYKEEAESTDAQDAIIQTFPMGETGSMHLLKDDGGFYKFYSHGQPVRVQAANILALADLPVYSGDFLATDGSLAQVSGLNLQQLWNQFRSDVNLLLSPETLLFMKKNNQMELLSRILSVKKQAIQAIAKRILPLKVYNDLLDRESLEDYVISLLHRNFVSPLETLTFVQENCECSGIQTTDNTQMVYYHGHLDQDDSLRSYLPVSVESGILNFAIPVQRERTLNHPNYVVDNLEIRSAQLEQVKWLSAGSNDFWKIPILPSDITLYEIDRSVPYTPVILSQEYKPADKTSSILFQCSFVAHDKLYYKLIPSYEHQDADDTEENNTEDISHMYAYAVNRSQLLSENNYSGLVELMENYTSALQSFVQEERVTPDLLDFEAFSMIVSEEDSEYLTGIETTDVHRMLHVYYTANGQEEVEMHRYGMIYSFDADNLPKQNETIELRFELQFADEESFCALLVERSQSLPNEFIKRTPLVNSANAKYRSDNDTLPNIKMKIRFYKPDDWSDDVRIHLWNATNESTVWPGVKMVDEGNGWYSYTSTQIKTCNAVIHDNTGRQTKDLGIDTDATIGVNIRFCKPSGWGGDVRIHLWNAGAYNTSWPGANMTDEGNGWYSYTNVNIDSCSFVINDINGNQTIDLSEFNAVTVKDNLVIQRPFEAIIIHFKKPSDWSSSLWIYYYTNNSQEVFLQAWPGFAMTSEGDDWYRFAIADMETARVIFTDKTSQYPSRMQPGIVVGEEKEIWIEYGQISSEPPIA